MTPERFARLRNVLDRRQPDLTVLMENTQKTHNIAAVLRSCDAVGVFEAHAVSPDISVPTHHMISAGTRKWVRLRRHRDIQAAAVSLRREGFRILAAHPSDSAVDYREADYLAPSAILLGSELPGVSDAAATLSDEHIVVPMAGMVTSLNVSVAAALVLFEARRQREGAGLYDSGPRLEPETYRRTLFEWAYPEIAGRCRRAGIAYPALDAHGQLARNPFA